MSIWTTVKDALVGGGSKALAEGTAQVMEAVDNLKIGDGEKAELRAKVMARLVDAHLSQQETVRAEISSGSWLGKNWRPLLALSWGFIVTYTLWFGPMFGLPVVPIEDKLWDLLVICITGYGSLRSVEKVSESVVPFFTAKQALKKLKLEMEKKDG